MLSTKAKDTPKVLDEIVIQGGARGHFTRGGLVSEDGKPVDPKLIAKNFGVSMEEAEKISRRLSL